MGPLLAKALGDVDVQYVWRFLREHSTDLAAGKSWCESNDPTFVAKAADIDHFSLRRLATMTDQPSLPVLERLVADDRHAEALQMTLKILQTIDDRGGRIDRVVTGVSFPGGSEEDVALIFATRFAAVFGRLITEQDLKITATAYEQLLPHYR